MTAIEVTNLTKRFGRVTALDDVTFALPENRIYGLLGRNGAGKTTLMQVLTGQQFATSGQVSVFGRDPVENEAVLDDVCFIRESQPYPPTFNVRHVLRAAALLHPRWDAAYAEELLDDFQLPAGRQVRKLSRGMASALGVVVGLASRAPLTLFDEPYLGLDAVSRQLFYDRLLADYAERPRTIVLSTHLIDEVSDLIEHVLMVDRGRLLVDEHADELRGRIVTVTGPAAAVDELAAAREELHREQLGGTVRATVMGAFAESDRLQAKSLGLELDPVPLQELMVRIATRESTKADGSAKAGGSATPDESTKEKAR